jgi:hypothetical protein
MKRLISMAVVLVGGALFLAGCATPYPMGAAYTDISLPGAATSNEGGAKVGVSKCTTILGLVATGDASIMAAMREGGITRIHHVDWSAKNILGVYGEYTTTVHGD